MSRRVHITVSISAEEALARLDAAIDQRFFTGVFSRLWSSPKAPYGRVRADRFRFRLNPRLPDASTPSCRGHVEPAAEGAAIEAVVGTRWWGRVFLAMWFSGAATPGVLAIVGEDMDRSLLIGSAILLTMGGLIVAVGHVFVAREARKLEEALRGWFSDVTVTDPFLS